MKGMNQFAKTHSHALTLLKGSMEKKKANFYVEKGYPSLNHFLDQKHRTPFYGEIEMGVKKIKGTFNITFIVFYVKSILFYSSSY